MASTRRRHLEELSGRHTDRQDAGGSNAGPADSRTGFTNMKKIRLFGLPGFWAILLLAAIALLVTLLTSCGRMGEDVGGSSASPEETPSASAVQSAILPASPETTASDTPEPSSSVIEAEAWPIPRGSMTDAGLMYGYVDREGKFLIDPMFESAEPFTTRGLAVVADNRGACAVIDWTGEQVIPWKVADIALQDNGLVLVRLTSGESEYDYTGTEVYNEEGKLLFTHPDYLASYSEGYAPSLLEGRRGYLDETGRLAIPLEEQDLGAFVNGFAPVAKSYGQPRHYVGTDGMDATAAISNGISVFLDTDSQLFGYRNADGSVLVPASFLEAEPFRDGTAIVQYNSDPTQFGGLYGLLGTDGKYRIDPESSGIRRLGNGLFAVGEMLGEPNWLPWDYMNYVMLALFDSKGRALTDFVMTDIQDAGEGAVAVCDGKAIRFVDSFGLPRADLPTIQGQGILKLDGGYLTGVVDRFSVVLDKKGNPLAVLRNGMDLGEGLYLSDEIAEGSRFTDLKYPVLSGMADSDVEARINKALKDAMGASGIGEQEKDPDTGMSYVETVEGGWHAWRVGDLLCVEQDAYWYALGAAHGMPSLETLHLDLTTGSLHSLGDLFKADEQEAAMALLSRLVTETIVLEMEEVGYFVESVEVLPTQTFRLTEEGLVLYWPPYELASYAAGFRDFLIPWATLDPVLDKAGSALWHSMNLE